jgi:hypothetical protein
MKKLLLISLFFSMTSVAIGEVSLRVCMADVNIAPSDVNIVVGTKLSIIVSSDANGYWFGDLSIEGNDINYGVLSARDFNDNTTDWEGSRFDAAGELARVWTWENDGIAGFSFGGDDNAIPGDWFIIDYTATSIGHCTVKFYEAVVHDPNRDIRLTHDPTHIPNFNEDFIVNFVDFDLLASYWQVADCNDPNWCEGADIDNTGSVDGNDLALFVDYWVVSTDLSCLNEP